jgi:hypothetical protein
VGKALDLTLAKATLVYHSTIELTAEAKGALANVEYHTGQQTSESSGKRDASKAGFRP